MNHDQKPTDDDLLLQRYREANALDDARPGAALREQVLAQARSVAQARTLAPPLATPGAANDSVWSWKAFGGLAVLLGEHAQEPVAVEAEQDTDACGTAREGGHEHAAGAGIEVGVHLGDDTPAP